MEVKRRVILYYQEGKFEDEQNQKAGYIYIYI